MIFPHMDVSTQILAPADLFQWFGSCSCEVLVFFIKTIFILGVRNYTLTHSTRLGNSCIDVRKNHFIPSRKLHIGSFYKENNRKHAPPWKNGAKNTSEKNNETPIFLGSNKTCGQRHQGLSQGFVRRWWHDTIATLKLGRVGSNGKNVWKVFFPMHKIPSKLYKCMVYSYGCFQK